MTCRCNNCMRMFEDDDDLKLFCDNGEYYKGCPDCGTDEYLMDMEVEE